MKTVKSISKQLFGEKYESIWKSLLASVILFFAIHAAELKLVIAPFILYLTSTFFTAGVMWQMLNGSRHIEAMQGMFMLPFENRNFVFSYASVLGTHTLITKTLLIWVLFFAVAAWNIFEIVVALLCGCMACFVASAAYLMFKKMNIVLPVIWAACILYLILIVRQSMAVLIISIVSITGAMFYLFFADAYDFYHVTIAKKSARHIGHTGNILVYLVRYLMANKSYLINTVGLCAVAVFLPLLFGEFHGLNILPLGFAILCLNTPICTLLSCDPDFEQTIRVLPGQASRFYIWYCLFICFFNGFIACIYLCSWQLINGGINVINIWIAVLFAMQSAILSATLEWVRPIRNWKTESDLWHHPRKYLVPLLMMLVAAFVSTSTPILWIWSVILLFQCWALLYMTRRL